MNRTLAIYLPSLASGGAERVHIGLAPAFIAAGWDVIFLLQRAEGAFLDSVPRGARIVSLDCGRTLASLMPLIRFLKREKPGILLSNLGHNNILAIWAAALARVPTRVIVSQHNTLSAECAAHPGWQYKVLPLLYRLFLPRAHGIVCVSQGVADDLAKVAHISRERITVIYNPVIFDDFNDRIQATAAHPWIAEKRGPLLLAVGRLQEQKDFGTLISAFALVSAKRDARLIVLGEGPLRAGLAAHAKALGVGERMDMPGFAPNPLPFMREADLLVMSSRYEGFGNVLVEALACGTPVVSTDCPHGPSEILEGGRFGRLVPVADAKAMATAISEALDHPPLARDVLTARGREFTAERAAAHYLRLFDAMPSTPGKATHR